MKKMIVAIFALIMVQISFTQELDNALRNKAIDQISQSLIDVYVFPDIGKECANLIKSNLEKGHYDQFEFKKDFARQLTIDLQSISKDKHMRVRVKSEMVDNKQNLSPEMERLYRRIDNRKFNNGFFKVEILNGNIGYIDMRSFSDMNGAKGHADAAFRLIESTNAVIMDMRKNSGGSPATVQYVCSHFFDKKIHLNSLYWRRGDRTVEYWTTDVAGKKRPDVPLFVLTSGHTFSGAEEFTYNMLTQKRAKIIGEVTGGGANPGGSVPVLDDMMVFIPSGKAINPITGTNWEGTGVTPHIEVSADSAFEVALRLARKDAEKYKAGLIASGEIAVNKMLNGLKTVESSISSGQRDNALITAKDILEASIAAGLSDEGSLNGLGYRYLGEKKYDMAIIIFKFNVYKYPDSFNVFDSLGEAFMEKGENENAIINYKKSIELNPENQNGIEMLKKLGVY